MALDIGYTTIDVGEGELHKYKLDVNLRNEGRGIAKYYGFDIRLPKLALVKKRGTGDPISNPHRIRRRDEGTELVILSYRSGRGDPPIFPGETIRILPSNYYGGHVNYWVDQEIWDKFNDKGLRITIYCENANTKDIKIPFSNLNNF